MIIKNDIKYFDDIYYLSKGNSRQRISYSIIRNNFIFEKLKFYNPVLAGTIPIEIDIWNSDLDVLCHWENRNEFIIDVTRNFEKEDRFNLYEAVVYDIDTVIANFYIENIEIEIFGQNIPVKEQFGYRHMLIEYGILQERGEEFKKEIIKLKDQGYKTEPAFAKLLELNGNPYIELLKYEKNKLVNSLTSLFF